MVAEIPLVIAGPIIRHVSQSQLTFWLVTNKSYSLSFELYNDDEVTLLNETSLSSQSAQQITIGEHAVINLISIPFNPLLKKNTLYAYDFILDDGKIKHSLANLLPELRYPSHNFFNFAIKPDIQQIFHGSCRKPHFESPDGLVQVDNVLNKNSNNAASRPSMLIMSGDQIYADDVAGPTLVAIHQVIQLLGLFDEKWTGDNITNSSDELFKHRFCYYQRDALLPKNTANQSLLRKILSMSQQPVFTSDTAKNHLVTLAEVFAMYLLVWSPTLWRLVNLHSNSITSGFQAQYRKETKIINSFVNDLPKVSRALAHIPVYMIFDDHDITDDWNLTRGWEEAAYTNPFSKRIIGNALVGYWLCQGWGNASEKFTELNSDTLQYFPGTCYKQQDKLIDEIFAFHQWHFSLATTPKIIVLDTRTQRWRSESSSSKPSGLMDWEALSELQQELINQTEVILVSAAPIYGVKMIETIQRFFTFIGLPLMVDAENWMAHSGTANVMLNIFRHHKTPPHFIILSGDVHYSFFYEVTHRFRRSDSIIFQITSSGIKNQFPTGLLKWLERLNRYLYATYSPLNWFTKRRRMKIKVRRPEPSEKNTLVNQSGIGLITLTKDKDIVKAELLTHDHKRILFHSNDKNS
ncbi:MAG: hypothetical protein ACJAXJ_003823 [Colwellia sp.]|jgi:hypothetical protein